jgi:hypothetical protein
LFLPQAFVRGLSPETAVWSIVVVVVLPFFDFPVEDPCVVDHDTRKS